MPLLDLQSLLDALEANCGGRSVCRGSIVHIMVPMVQAAGYTDARQASQPFLEYTNALINKAIYKTIGQKGRRSCHIVQHMPQEMLPFSLIQL